MNINKEEYLIALESVSNNISKNFIKLSNRLINEFGLIEACILSKLLERHNLNVTKGEQWVYNKTKSYGKKALELASNNYFYIGIKELEKSLMVGEDKIRKTLRIFENRGILEILRAGNPSRNFFKINYKELDKILKKKNKDKKPSDFSREYSKKVDEKQERENGKFSQKNNKNVIDFSHRLNQVC